MSTDERARQRAARAEQRARRRSERRRPPLLDVPFRAIHIPFPPLELMDAEAEEAIHQASLQILEEVGVEFLDDEALDLWTQAGADVDRPGKRVRMDRHLLLELVAKAPSRFTWHARNPERTLTVGGNRILFAPNGGTVFASDLDRGRRPGTLEDYCNFVRLVQMCNVIHTTGDQLVVPHDLPVSHRHLERMRVQITLSDKALQEAAHGRIIPQDALALAERVFGSPLPEDGPVLAGVINVNSPLRYDERMLGGLIAFARAGQALIITPFILAGVMSPASIPAAVALQNAETLAGIALAQVVRPGTPVLYGGFTTNVDLRSGAPAFGTPEGAWALIMGAQMARRYGLPYRGSGTLTTAKVPDAEAAYQTSWSIWPCVLSHTNFVLHSVGWLESGLTASFEKFVMDAEHLAQFQHFLSPPVVNSETLALDFIREVGPGGHHLGTGHTAQHFATAFFQPGLADRLPYETWTEAGGYDMARRANQLWKQLLAEYEPPPLDPAIREAVDDYVERRKRELIHVNLYG